MSRNRSIRLQIFKVFSIIMVLAILILTLITFSIFSTSLRNTSIEALENVSNSIATNIETTIKNIDQTNLNIVYSYLIKNDFQEYSIDNPGYVVGIDQKQTYKSETERKLVKEIVNILIAIKGPGDSTAQLALHTFSGLTIATNNRNHFYTDLKEKVWFDDVINKNGHLYITKPYSGNDLQMSTDTFTGESLISICRVIFDGTNTPMGIAEAKQYSFKIFEPLENTLPNSIYESYIFNERGDIVFPYETELEQEIDGGHYLDLVNLYTGNDDTGPYVIRDKSNGRTDLLCYSKLPYSDWTLVLIAPERKILSPLYRLTTVLILTSIILAIVSLIISFFAARKITIPIKLLSEKIHNYEIEQGFIPLNLESGLNEIEDLNDSFSIMSSKMKESLEQVLLLQNQDMQSRMLALQSQISPHFIYNSLSIISVMAEEKMNSGIIEMSSAISDILRYTSSDDSMYVPIDVEIEYAKKYLACMKFRFQDKLQYKIKLGNPNSRFKIPKLSIQPLIENSLKYATKNAPPWIITIDVSENEKGYRVSVCDNGNGFDDKILNLLKEKMSLIDLKNILPNLNLEGMGLMNIYIRLKILYGDDLVFTIENGMNGGSRITFGSDKFSSTNEKKLKNVQSILDGDSHE